jgi:hypothetical protein
MSDTPETGAFFAEWTRTDGVLARSRLHAEKLERERDEARNRFADALQELDLRTLDFERVKAERDDLRDRLNELLNRPTLV